MHTSSQMRSGRMTVQRHQRRAFRMTFQRQEKWQWGHSHRQMSQPIRILKLCHQHRSRYRETDVARNGGRMMATAGRNHTGGTTRHHPEEQDPTVPRIGSASDGKEPLHFGTCTARFSSTFPNHNLLEREVTSMKPWVVLIHGSRLSNDSAICSAYSLKFDSSTTETSRT